MARQKFPYKTAVAIRLEHPTDEVGSNPLDFTNDAATAAFKVFDPAKDEVLTADEIAAQTVLSVSNVGVFDDADVVEIDLDDDTIHSSTISSIDVAAGTITIAVGLPSQASEDARVRTRLGSSIAMTEYGTARLGKTDWGFVGTLPKDHPGLKLGLEIDVEIDLDGGAGVEQRKTICAVIASDKDCAEYA